MKRTVSLILACATVVALLSGCGNKTTDTASNEGGSADGPHCVFFLHEPSVFDNTVSEHTLERWKELGGSGEVVYYYSNESEFQKQVENAITAKADALFVRPYSEEACQDVIQSAVEQGIVVCTYDMEMPNVDATYTQKSDNTVIGEAIGKMAAEWANENLVAKGISVKAGVLGVSFDPEMLKRADTFQATLKEYCPEAEIVMVADATDNTTGAECCENFLAAYPDMNLVMSIFDDSAVGFYDTLTSMNISQEFGIFACNATTEACRLISEDTYFKGTLALSPDEVGRAMADAIYGAVTGTGSIKPGDGVVEPFPCVAVTKENVADYMN